MKKYYLYIIALILLLGSCTPFADEESDPVQNASDPTITISNVQDSSFVFKITTASETGFYSYAVIEGKQEELDPSKLFSLGYDALKTETTDAKAAPEISVKMEKLIPNTSYCVYAVAASVQGTVGNVIVQEVLTTDGLIPCYVADEDGLVYQTDKMGKFAIQFNEPVVKTDNMKAAAYYYKLYPADPAESFEKIDLPADSVSVDGDVALFSLPYKPGAFAFVTWEPGSFANLVGTLDKGFDVAEFAIVKGKVQAAGFVSHLKTKEWEIKWADENEAEDTTLYFADPADAAFIIDLSEQNLPGTVNEKVVVKMIYHNLDGSVYSIPLANNVSYAYDPYFYPNALLLFSSTEPDFATTVDIEIGAGAFIDEWGNPNAEYVREKAFMRLIESTGLEGQYLCSTTDLFGYTYQWNITIVKEPDETYSVYNLDPWVANQIPDVPIGGCEFKDGKLMVYSGSLVLNAGSAWVMFYAMDNEAKEDKDFLHDVLPFTVDELGWLHNELEFGMAVFSKDEIPQWTGQATDIIGRGQNFIKVSNDVPDELRNAASTAVRTNYVELNVNGLHKL